MALPSPGVNYEGLNLMPFSAPQEEEQAPQEPLAPAGQELAQAGASAISPIQPALPLDPNKAPPSSVAPKGTVPDAYTLAKMGEVFAQQKAQEVPNSTPPRAPKGPSSAQARANIEAYDPKEYFNMLNSVSGIPTKDKLAYLSKFKETDQVNLDLKGPVMSGAYQLAKLAEDRGLQVVFQSGKRDRGGESYHDHGEAVDVRFLRKAKDGRLLELTPEENVKVGVELGKKSGFASALDEFHYYPNGRMKRDIWNEQPHVHLAWGNERNLEGQPIHHKLANRHWSDANYLAQPAFQNDGYKPSPAASKRSDRAGLPGLAETIAWSQGIDADVFVNLIGAESSWNPNAVSSANAYGLGQMLPGTVKEVVPKIGATEEQYYKDPKVQIRASAYYFKQQLDRNKGNYARALAAYNSGQGGLETQIQSGKVVAETSEYVHKILGQKDPTINSREAADAAILQGTGFTRDTNADKQAMRDTVYSAKKETQSLWSTIFGDEGSVTRSAADSVASYNPLNSDNYKNPLSGVRKASQTVNEILHDFSLGVIPITQSSLESQKEGDAIMASYGEGDNLIDRAAAGYGRTVTTLGVGGLRAMGGAASAGILGKSLRVLPVLGKWLQAGDRARLALAATEEGAGIAEGAGLMNKIKGVVAGGPMDLFTRSLTEQAITGGLTVSAFTVNDLLWNNKENQMTPLEIAAHGLGGMFLGAVLAIGTSIGLPLLGGVGLTIGNRLTGAGSMSGETAVGAIASEIAAMNPVKRTLTTGLGGAMLGAGTGALADVTGVTQGITGEDPGLGSSMLTGAMVMGGMGGAAGLGGPAAGAMIDKAMASKLMQSPAFQNNFMAPLKEQLGKMNASAVKLLSEEVIQNQRQQMNFVKNHQAHANMLIHTNQVKGSIANAEASLPKEQAVLANAQAAHAQLEHKAQMLEHMQSQLDAKYPQASAFEASRAQKVSELQQLQGGQPNPAKQAKAASLTQDLQAMDKAAKSNKDLAAQRDARNLELQRLQQQKAMNASEMAKAKTQLEFQKGVVDGYDQYLSDNRQKVATMEAAIAKNADLAELSNLRHEVINEGGWNYDRSDPRARLLDSAQEHSRQNEAYSDMLTRQTQEAIHNGRTPYNAEDVRLQQNIVGKLPGTPEQFVGTHMERIKQLKEEVKTAENWKPKATGSPISPSSAKSWKKTVVPDWAMTAPKGHSILAVDAQSLRAGILQELESTGATVDRGALRQEAIQRSKMRYAETNTKVPAFDKANLLELAKDAESVMELGDEQIPVVVPKGQVKEVQGILGKGAELAQAQAKKQALDQIQALEASLGATYEIKGQVNPLMSGHGEDAVPVRGGLADEAILDHIYKPELGWNSIATRVHEIESQVKAALGKFGDVESFTNFLDTGNVSLLPDEVASWVRSGGDLASAPESVKAWSEAVTMARMEEITRLRQLDYMTLGKGEQGELMMSQLRAAQAAGYTPPEFGSTPQPLFKGLASTSQMNSWMTWFTNKNLAEIAAGDSPSVFKQVFGIAQEAYRDLMYSRMGAAEIIKNRMVKPAFQQIENRLMDEIRASGSGKELPKIYRELADAVQDTSLLRKFREDHPEATPLVDFYYGMQNYMEAVVSSSPKLKPWIQANYLPMRFKKLAAHAAASVDGELISLAQATAEQIKKYPSLKAVDAAVDAITKEIKDNGFSSAEEFINMDSFERAKRLKFFKDPNMDQAWKDLTDLERQRATKDATNKVVTLLMQDPVTHPMELLEAQMDSIFRADSQRQFLQGLRNMPVNSDTLGKTQYMVEITGSESKSITDSKGVNHTYKRLEDIPGFAGAKLEIDGKEYGVRDIQLHPEAYRFLKDYTLAPSYSENGLVRAAQRLQSVVRSTALLGSFIPHNLSILSGHMMDFVKAPLKMMGMNVGGANLGLGDQISQAAITANAVRMGLNIRSVDRITGFMAKETLDTFGPETGARLYGVESNPIMKVLQALDVGDPMHKEAINMLRESPGGALPFGLGTLGRLAAGATDVLGIPLYLDQMLNREFLFKPIEMGQLAGFHMRAQKILIDNQAALSHLEPAERMRVAMKQAADQCNRIAGAYPHIYQNKNIRGAMQALTITPSWALSKGYMIVDAIDSVAWLAGKALTGKEISPAALFGRRAFENVPEAMRAATRARMAGMVAAGLVSSFAMAQTAQYMYDGTWITDHPPDKLFHVKVGNEYYGGPTVGFVKDLVRFGTTWAGADPSANTGVLPPGYSLTLQGFVDATTKGIIRQLNPSIPAMMSSLSQTMNKEVISAPEVVVTFLSGAAEAVTGSQLEMLGLDKNKFSLENAPGFLGLGSEEQKRGAQASTLKARNYLLRQAGIYNNPDNLDMQIRGKYFSEVSSMASRQKGLIQPLLDRAKESDSAAEQAKWLNQAYDAFYQGVPVKDAAMRDYYPEGVYRLSDEEFKSMLTEAFNPAESAMEGLGNTPGGLMVSQTRALHGRY